ncbi:uncharacterized protein RJT20DRAFT_125493 [Scheffersomyces xylosifermentans]|uniref:uncharacterized protein n=1 Tax=Scheffersomyces xylosifermentans TaxID=1304137 RepID=UPI00315D7047
MSYDPIHDTYTPSSATSAGSPASNGSGDANGSTNAQSPVSEPSKVPSIAAINNPSSSSDTITSAGSATSPTSSRNPLSIATLVSAPAPKTNSISNLINSTEADEEEEEYETDANMSIAHVSSVNSSSAHESNGTDSRTASGKKKKRKYTNTTIPKCRHLKKSDGEPFWRKDIQYDFLQALFDDETACFTNTFPHCDVPNANNNPKIPFSDLYIRTLVESSKCSKILKERLIKDTDLGKSVSKVCLLVNAGRMNTTINFVPEMRSTLRTYHSIPSLQADPQYGGSKPLQDTPRLKSILKAVCEDDNIPKDLDEILDSPAESKPNTNIIQIIFLLSNHPHGIAFHDTDNSSNTFMEFFLNSKIHPKNRARRLLWLLYTYLETDFKPEDLEENPFGSKTIPEVEYIPEDLISDFDKDTDYEIEYSERMFKTRIKYLNDEEHNSTPKRGNKSKKDKEAAEEEASLHEEIEADEHHDESEVNPRKRVHSSEDSGPKKRKSKRNATLHQTTVPSPLTKNVITFSVESVKKDDIDDAHGSDFLKHHNSKLKSNIDAIQFPIKDLDILLHEYVPLPDLPSQPNEHLSVVNLNNLVEQSRPVVRSVRTSSKASTASFNKKTTILGNWLYRYFRYKKSIGNKLLGMEWEDIRYDLVNGLENYIYQQFGKSLKVNEVAHDPIDDAEQTSPIAKENEVAEITPKKEDDFGFKYLPVHDFNRSNEKNTYILQLATFCNDWFVKRVKEQLKDKKAKDSFKISFNLDQDIVDIPELK